MCYGNQTWSEESLMWVYNDDDLHGGQRSSEVKCGKLCAMATKLGQHSLKWRNREGHHYLKLALAILLTKFGNHGAKFTTFDLWWPLTFMKNPWCKFMMMMTFMEVKGHHRSNAETVIWLPNLVRRNPGASLWWWWWPSWRSKVIRG